MMKRFTLNNHNGDTIATIVIESDGKYTVNAGSDMLTRALAYVVVNGIICKRTENLDAASAGTSEPVIVEIDAVPGNENFFDQLKLYFETSFDYVVILTDSE